MVSSRRGTFAGCRGVIVLATPPPALPNVGEIWWVSRDIRSTRDKKESRPCVVVRVPPTINGRIVIVTRTSDADLEGVGLYSPPIPANGLKREGIWSHRETVEGRLWKPPEVRGPRGPRLDVAEISDILWTLRIAWEAP